MLVSAPTYVFCSSASDPCSCTGGAYQAIQSICTYLSADPIIQAQIFKSGISGRPSIPSRFLLRTNTSNITTYGLNLTMLQQEYKTYPEYLDHETLNIILLSMCIIVVIALTMILADAMLSFSGCKAALDSKTYDAEDDKLSLKKAKATLLSIEDRLDNANKLKLAEKIFLNRDIRVCEEVINAHKNNEETLSLTVILNHQIT